MVLFYLMVAVALLGDLLGYGVHTLIHQPWTGRIYRAHMTHHLKTYPPNDLLSPTYRSPGKDNGLLFFTPLIVLGFAVIFCGLRLIGLPWAHLLVLVLEAVLIGVVHDYVHDAMHIEGHWLERFRWFRRARSLHFWHHRSMRKNLGILMFLWDRAFSTFKSLRG